MENLTDEEVMNALREVYDPEIGYDIVSLGLIYGIDIDPENNIKVTMTLTTPMCPLAGFIVEEARRKVKDLEKSNVVDMELSFDPPWNPEMVSDELKKTMGL